MCACWSKTNQALSEKGFRLSSKCTMFFLGHSTLEEKRIIPLETAEGRKPGKGAPNGVVMSFCPFCGQKYPEGAGSDAGVAA